ncbi:MAG TPA: MBL fold metallo-hydrolase [Nitrososphaerales archaeon]|nr:MBL fold metallo-hydrolase [Nitrososphaerales archaeon]
MSEPLFIEQIPVGAYRNFSYLVADLSTLHAAIFDPAWEIESLLSRINGQKLQLDYIINTHAHLDHIQGNIEIKRRTGAKIVMYKSSLALKDLGVSDGEQISISHTVTLKFIHTPGHSPESMCVQVNDRVLITGDTLFIGECGRTDLPGGDASALFDSFEKLRRLEPSLIIYPGHDYGKTPSATLGEELKSNYTLAKRTHDEFVKFMSTP